MRVVVIVAILAASFQATFGQQADPRREPATALEEAVRLLEGRHYAEFFQKYASPAELDGAVKRFGSVENVVVEFNRAGRFELALKAFQAAMKTPPEFTPDGTRANYRFDAPIGGEIRLQLRKIDGLWYWND